MAASQTRPLVTEWPASEKSRLEAMLSRGGVAVSYTGCEMRLIEGCTAGGAYGFQRTTLATDQLEIQNEDDLFGKLPLGAIRLEGDLRRSGRLAVKTTVVGQFSLEGASLDASPRGACAEATHVIVGMSVGSFKLLSGGKVAASGGAGLPSAHLGSGGSREEITLTEAGDEKACAEARGPEAPDRCRSPLQLFLRPLAGAVPSAERPSATTTLFDGKVLGEQRWSLYRGNDMLCTLPCKTPIDPLAAGYQLRGEGGSLDLKTRSEWRGRTAQIEVSPSRGSVLGIVGLSVGSGVLGMGLMIGGFTAYSSINAPDNETSEQRSDRRAKQLGYFFGGFGVWVVGGLGVAYYSIFYKRSASYDLLLIEQRQGQQAPRWRVGLDGVALQASPTTRLHLSPFGLSGQF